MPTLPGIDLYWFSGTGNSLLVAEAMADELRRLGRDVALLPLEISDPASVRSDRMLGLAFPVAAFSTYPLVWRFVEALPTTASATPAFMVDTMASKSGGIVGPLGRRLAAKGYQLVGAREIIMPGNFLGREKEAKEQEKVAAGLAAARAYAADLDAGRAVWPKDSLRQRIVCRMSRMCTRLWRVRWLRVMNMVTDRAKCTRCGLCVQLCPTGAIRLADFPVHDARCEYCQRCAGICPAGAIHMRCSVMKKPYLAVPADRFPRHAS